MKKELTKNEALQKCRDMWNEIADIIEEENRCLTKREYFSRKGISGNDVPIAECYCCQYDSQVASDCFSCPLSFPKKEDGQPSCTLESSPYYLCREATYNGDWESGQRLILKK